VKRRVDGAAVYHCDCNAAAAAAARSAGDGGGEGSHHYAGRFCQYRAGQYCTKDPGLAGHLFCVNGGTCRGDNPYQGCDCRAGYAGFSCEYVTGEALETVGDDGGDAPAGSGSTSLDKSDGAAFDFATGRRPDDDGGEGGSATGGFDFATGRPLIDPADEIACDLVCRNGGACRSGIPDTEGSAAGQQLRDIAIHAPHLDPDADGEPFQHCVCPPGYGGPLCGQQVEVCGESEHLCLHGSKCVEGGGGDDELQCDCSEAGAESAEYYAGRHCEHPVTDICSEPVQQQVPGTPISFCVNGGTCKKRVAWGEAHAGCICAEGFLGPHCELREDAPIRNKPRPRPHVETTGSKESSSSSSSSSSSGEKRTAFHKVMLTFSVLALTTVTLLLAGMYVRRKRQRNRAVTGAINWASHYLDHPSDEPNIAPRRRSTYTDVYEDSSSTDPMASAHILAAQMVAQQDSSPIVSDDEDDYTAEEEETRNLTNNEPQVYLGPPRDEDGHELHNVDIV
jgi:hypothetical protein